MNPLGWRRRATAGTDHSGAIPTDAEIVDALRRKAGKGDAVAARELREGRMLDGQALRGDAWIEALLRQIASSCERQSLERSKRASAGQSVAREPGQPHPPAD
jgi:hypothetical protein